MKALGSPRSRVLLLSALVGCTGLDPQRFGPGERPSSLGGQAGYSFDAGLGGTPSAAGRSTGTAGRAEGVAGGRVAGAGGFTDEPAGGEGGFDDVQGDGGTPSGSQPPAGDGGRSAAGSAGSAQRGGAASGANGGASARGGASGAAGLGGYGGVSPSAGGGHGAGSSGAAGSDEPAGVGGVAGVGGGMAGSAGGSEIPAVHALVFSEYVEGSASYKALEVFAETASTLDGCRLVTYSNGSATGGAIALAGGIAAGSVYTLCSSTLADLLGTACDRTTNLSFNGDDAVALECEGATLDVIGQIGLDPGTAWTGPSGSTLNATLRRRCDHLFADPDGTDPFDPDVAFTPLPVDTFDGLGHSTCG